MADDHADGRPYRPFVHTIARAVALPHGYTLLLWCTTMATVERHGLPGLLSVFCLLGGACGAYLGIGFLGRRTYGGAPRLRPTVARPYLVAIGNFATLAVATGACSLVALIPPDPLAWLAVGVTGTGIYLLGFATQAWIVSRVHAD